MHKPSSVVGLALLLALAVATTHAAPGVETRADREAVAELMYCYARGTDEIGDATTHPDPLAAGLAVYQGCFAPDAEFRAWFPQQPFDSQTFPNPDAHPDTAPAPFVGPAAWAGFVNAVFRGNGYTFTQHMITNVDVQLQGNRALLTAYLNATHVISGEAIGGPSRCVAVANGTYSMQAVKRRGRWVATGLDLTLITFNPIFQTGAGC
ncbi:MAG TPA: nuclear transport factor 2 family protein [Steroidobacteraceae bacterium]|nr:nuclear transport factor 2 family protein [Steroidobacteraceae bacterium]